MIPLLYVFLSFLFSNGIADDNTRFPPDFLFGAATSSYQIEGAWDEDGKGENIWDRVAHTNPSFIKNNDNGDVTCDSYHKYKDDVAILAELNVTHYRFSISWSRLLPNGLTNQVNQAAVTYYNNLISELKKHNIEPFVTLFHWDTPQYIEELGGWPNPDIVTWYSSYAQLCFELFGKDVKHWMTFNEAKQTCTNGYGTGSYAPVIKSPGIAEYLCIHNVIKSHAAVWHIYDKNYRKKQQGKVGIVIDSNWWEPHNATSVADQEASEKKLQFTFGIYANPLINGDYPEIVKSSIKSRSLSQGFTRSRLPEFTEDEINDIKGTVDFLGVNQYSSSYVTPAVNPDPEGKGYVPDSEVEDWFDPSWPSGASDWLVVTPWGVRKLLKWIKETYNNPVIIITENGYSDFDGTLDDQPRIDYIQSYLSNIKAAMDEDGVNVIGYTVWSLLDNLEWLFGFTNKFGLYQVDFNSPNRTRTAKKSATFYKNLIQSKCLGNCDVTTTNPPTTTIAPTTTVAPTNPPTTTVAPTNPPTTTIAPTNPPTTTVAPTNPPTTTIAPTNPPTTTVAPTNPPTTTIAPTNPPTTTLAPTNPPTTTIAPTNPPTTTVAPTNPPTTTIAPTNPPTTTLAPTNPPTTTVAPTNPPTTTVASNILDCK